MEKVSFGTIVQVVGPIVDVKFEKENLPKLLTALEISLGENQKLVVEVLQHIGNHQD